VLIDILEQILTLNSFQARKKELSTKRKYKSLCLTIIYNHYCFHTIAVVATALLKRHFARAMEYSERFRS
jgi:hypothetical protein